MAVASVELANELKILRKGRGLQTPKLADQVGAALRELCGITENDGTTAIREKLTTRLRVLANGLPDDLRLVATTVLAMHAETRQQFLQERVRGLAEQQQRDVRTIRRRMDEAFDLLAELATSPAGPERHTGGRGWYIERMEAILRMDKASPECFERRRIVAERDGLASVEVLFTLPRDPADGRADGTDAAGGNGGADPASHDLFAELYFGAEITGRTRRSDIRFAWELRLPRPLAAGERHEYGIVHRIPTDQPMRPHYAFIPDRRCDRFDLRIRFDRAHPPHQVWRVAEAFHRDIDEPRRPEELLRLDRVGELVLSFHDLLPGHGYGAQWATGVAP